MMKLDIVSKYRGPLYGTAILWVVLYHAQNIDKCDWAFGAKSGLLPWIGDLIGELGNTGVDIFLFLSGICLYFSFVRNSDLRQFMKKRLTRIFIPLLIIDGVYWFVRILIIQGDPLGFVDRLLLTRFWITGDATCWYGSLIVVLYFLYPFFYSFMFSPRAKRPWARALILIALAMFLCVAMHEGNPDYYNLVERCVTRIPIFIFGAWMGKLVYEKREVGGKWLVALMFAIAFIYVAQCHYDVIKTLFPTGSKMLTRFWHGVGGISFSYCLAYIFYGIDTLVKNRDSYVLRFLSWVGGFSFELYLSSIALNQIWRILPLDAVIPGYEFQYDQSALLPYLLILMPLSILVAWGGSKATGAIAKRIPK